MAKRLKRLNKQRSKPHKKWVKKQRVRRKRAKRKVRYGQSNRRKKK
jgi:hypothetical protein